MKRWAWIVLGILVGLFLAAWAFAVYFDRVVFQ